jgi:hypothetical protein
MQQPVLTLFVSHFAVPAISQGVEAKPVVKDPIWRQPCEYRLESRASHH